MLEEMTYIKRLRTTLYLDVGANRGQTGQMLRRVGYAGRIVSFEPIGEVYADLATACADDRRWEAYHTAVGDRDGAARIGVSENFVSSSILPATEAMIEIHAPIRYTRHEDIKLSRLDTILPKVSRPQDRIHLKIDTQGFEQSVINGATESLSRISSIRMEVAISECYTGEWLVPEAIIAMRDRGFVLVDTSPAWRNPHTGVLLHLDLIFLATTVDLPSFKRRHPVPV